MNSHLPFLNRRHTLAILGGAGAAAFTGSLQVVDAATSCVALAGQQTEGPYWVDEKLNRSDIRVDTSDGSVRPGVLLNLSIALQESSGSSCTPLAGARVDIWHCDATGVYSDEAVQNSTGKTFLRGYQVSDDSGTVQFTTIYPGWYSGRTVHIHVRIRTYSGSTLLDNFTAQIFFDDTVTDQIFAQNTPYSARRARDTRNANDMVVAGTSNGSVVYGTLTQTSVGYSAAATIGANVKTAAVSKPVITSGGVVNAAGFQVGVAPGAWTTIFGQNLASANHALTSADLVSGNLPTTLAGVSVQIDGNSAFVDYVSPTQLNVQAPSSAN
ncbi:MAG: intradiol ring-cleavage dioxygenase, partial [Bryobacterales bacterium]|nr:intradiol ring-cleavage dioxygenase [Bryobacterales bacterium]